MISLKKTCFYIFFFRQTNFEAQESENYDLSIVRKLKSLRYIEHLKFDKYYLLILQC